MENKNYVNVGNIIEQERLKREAQIAKGINPDVFDHIEKAYEDDFSKSVDMDENLSRFAADVSEFSKAETEFLLNKIQRQINVDPQSQILKSMKNIAIQHINDIEKAKWKVGDEKQYNGVTYVVSGLNAKGTPLWRKKKDGSGGTKTETQSEKSGKNHSDEKMFYKQKIKEIESQMTPREDADYNEALVQNDKKSQREILQSVYKRIKKQKGEKQDKVRKTNNGNFSGLKFTEILDSLDDWNDDDWNNGELNDKLTDAIKSAIKKEGIDEKKFKEIAKKYQGLDLVYTDYVPKSSNLYKKYNSK